MPDQNPPQDEISRLLQNPDPVERAMALKMAGVTPEHLNQVIRHANQVYLDTKSGMAKDDLNAMTKRAEEKGLVERAMAHSQFSHINHMELASHPELSRYWEKLTDHEHLPEVGQRILESAKYTKWPGQAGEWLSRSHSASPETIRQAMKELPDDTNDWKTRLALHPSAPQDVKDDRAEEIIKDWENRVPNSKGRERILSNARLSPHVFQHLNDPKLDPEYRKELTQNHSLPNHVAHQIAEDPEQAMELAKNPGIGDDVITALLNKKNADLNAVVANNPNIKSSHIDQILGRLGDEDYGQATRTLGGVMKSRSLTPEHLSQIYANRSANGVVDAAMAEKIAQQHLSRHMTDKLINDPSDKVKRSVAVNHDLNADQAKRLLTNTEDKFTHEAMVNRLAGGDTHLKPLASAVSDEVIPHVLANKDLYPPGVRRALIKKAPLTDEQLKNQISKDPDFVAHRPNLSPDVIKHLVDYRIKDAPNLESDHRHILDNGLSLQENLPPEEAVRLAQVSDSDLHHKLMSSKNYRNEQVQHALLNHGSDGSDERANVVSDMASDPRTHSSVLQRLWNEKDKHDPNMFQSVADKLASRENAEHDLPKNLIDKLVHDQTLRENGIRNLIDNPHISAESLRHLANGGWREYSDADPDTRMDVQNHAATVLAGHDPDSIYKEKVNVRMAPTGSLGRLRKIRDMILEKNPTGKELSPKQLPAGDWSVGRGANGNISADKLQQHIDSVPTQQWNVSHDTWTGSQKHSDENSKVFQLNLSTDHVNKLKQAGVWDTFQKMHQATKQSGHPAGEHGGIGWVRWTGGDGETDPQNPHKKQGVMVDEIQSDLGQNFSKQAAGQARIQAESEAKQQGMSPEQAKAHVETQMGHAEKVSEAEYPTDHYNKISKILFNGRHPNEVLAEAFMQHLRDKGQHDTTVQMHTPESKGPLSYLDMSRPVPGHFKTTYEKVPKALGAEPSHYGELTTQTNPDMIGEPEKAPSGETVHPNAAPTWSMKVRKTEVSGKSLDELGDWLRSLKKYEKIPQNPTDILGFQIGHRPLLDQALNAGSLFSHIEHSATPVRNAMTKHDGDHVAAAAELHGISTEALRAAMALTQPSSGPKSEPHQIKDVRPATRDAVEFAEAVQRAANSDNVQSIKLGGKHTAGTMLAQDPEGSSYLLKPGTQTNNPAAGDEQDKSSQSQREAAFWHAAKVMGLDEDIPHCELLLIDGHQVACMDYLTGTYKPLEKMREDDQGKMSRVLETYRQTGRLHQWAVMDAILGNVDRHFANVLIDDDGDVKLIDHGSAFAGTRFDPAHDKATFLPCYLRYNSAAAVNFHKLSPQDKMDKMEKAPEQIRGVLGQWFQNLDIELLKRTLLRFGIDPLPMTSRLSTVRYMTVDEPLDLAINRFWATI